MASAPCRLSFAGCLLAGLGGLLRGLRRPARLPAKQAEEAKSAPLLRRPLLSASEVSASLVKPRGRGALVFAVHHKTGFIFTNKALDRFGCRRKLRFQDLSVRFFWPAGAEASGWWPPWPAGAVHGAFYRDALEPLEVVTRCSYVVEPSLDWPLPDHARVVHLVRDPVSLILSGYRYHQHSIKELWNLAPSTCHYCDEPAHAAIFEACSRRCNYFDELNFVDEQTGVVLEALMGRQLLEVMLGNLQRWANEPRVLHLTPELLRRDHGGAVRCLLRFLGLDSNTTVGQKLMAEDMQRTRHATHGLHDNSRLRAFLRQVPAWRGQFMQVEAAMEAVFARQALLYGCPSSS